MKEYPYDRTKSIEELSGYYCFAPDFESNVVLRSHALRRKPLADLEPEDVRMGLIQQVGVSYLVPIAIDMVEQDPYVDVKNFPGEVTVALLAIPFEYWRSNEENRIRMQRVYERVEETKDTQDEFFLEDTLPLIREAHARFRGDLPSREWLRPLEIERERELWPNTSSQKQVGP